MVDTKMKPTVVCVGANLESEIALQGLINHQVNIVGLITRPPHSRAGISDYADLHGLCLENDISVIDSLNVNSDETIKALKECAPEYIFTLGSSQLFGDDFLNAPSGFVVGSHPSPLPAGRGRAPVPWTILQDLRQSAVTFFKMDTGADTGDILLQKPFRIEPDSYAIDVYKLVAKNLCLGFCELYEALQQGTITLKKQGADGASYRARRFSEDGLVDFCCLAEDIYRLVRAVSFPFPGAYAYYKGTKIEIWRAMPAKENNMYGTTGQILTIENERLLVQAGDTAIWLSDFTSCGETFDISNFRQGQVFNYRVQDEIHELRSSVDHLIKKLNL